MALFQPQYPVEFARVLFRLVGANMNSTSDQAFIKVGTFTNYLLTVGPMVTNTSASLTTAAGGIYSGASKSGVAIVAASQVYASAAGVNQGFNAARTFAGMGVMTATPFLSLTTPQGSAATADFYVIGVPLS